MYWFKVLAPVIVLSSEIINQLGIIFIHAAPHHVTRSGSMKWIVLFDDACFGVVLEVDFLFEVEHNAA